MLWKAATILVRIYWWNIHSVWPIAIPAKGGAKLVPPQISEGPDQQSGGLED